MDTSSADAFVYAKASGMLAKSFVGSRIAKLFSVVSLDGLWELLFKSEVPSVPEYTLVQMIEKKAEERFLQDFISLLKKYSKPRDFLVDLLRFYDYNNLKAIIARHDSAENRVNDAPFFQLASIGKYSMLDYDKWPSMAAMTAGTSVSWCGRSEGTLGGHGTERRLDSQYIQNLWNSASRLDATSRQPVMDLLKEEIILDNIVWSLRLRLYYGMSSDEVLERLVSVPSCRSPQGVSGDELVEPAAQTLSLPLNSYREWGGWKYSSLLNPLEDGVEWTIDPRWVQRAARFKLYKAALHQFHHHPFTAHVLFCWYKVKQYELDCIRMVAEGIRLKVSPAQVGKFAGMEGI